jgi:hypothetical protein
MKFATPEDVWNIINAGEVVRRERGDNRSLINNAANGVPPLSANEAAKVGLKVNCNFGEQAQAHAEARRQLRSAYYHTPRFFRMQFRQTCNVPTDKQQAWQGFITDFINGKMRDSVSYFWLRESTDAAVVAHGLGPVAWYSKTEWCPKVVPLEDWYVPTDTENSFDNLSWFAVRILYTEWDLAKRVFGPNRVPGWNKEAIKRILKEYHEDNTENLDYDWMKAPEKMWELIKENSGYYASDAVPTIPLLHLWFKDTDENKKECWKMRVICDTEVRGGEESNEHFLYDPTESWNERKKSEPERSEKPFARSLREILHCQFGDISNKSPFLVHATRSLGFMLMEPCYWSNLFLCRLIQHTMEQFNVWLRSNDPAGKARAQLVNMFDKAFLPAGVTIVPQNERHQIPMEAVESIMGRMKQLQAEKSATYTQQADSGTKKEQTAFETMTKVQQVNAMMEGILTMSFVLETFKYREICRRFCLSDTQDEDCKKFQSGAKKFGIRREYLNVELWDIYPELPVGGGNPTMEMAKLQQLMATRSQFAPPAQDEILQMWAMYLTDPRMGQRLVPLDKQKSVDSAQRDAEFAFGAIMASGAPVQHSFQYSPIEQLEVFLTLLGKVVDDMERDFSLVDAGRLKGAETAAMFSGSLLKQLAQRKDEKENVQKFAKIQGIILNALKGLKQRWVEQQQKRNGQADPAAMAKAQTTLMQGKTKMQIDAAKAQQKLAQNQVKFAQEQKRKTIGTALDEQRKTAQTIGEEKRKNLAAVGEEKRRRMKAFSEDDDK